MLALFVVGGKFDYHGFYYKVAWERIFRPNKEGDRQKQFPWKLQAVLMYEVANMKTRN